MGTCMQVPTEARGVSSCWGWRHRWLVVSCLSRCWEPSSSERAVCAESFLQPIVVVVVVVDDRQTDEPLPPSPLILSLTGCHPYMLFFHLAVFQVSLCPLFTQDWQTVSLVVFINFVIKIFCECILIPFGKDTIENQAPSGCLSRGVITLVAMVAEAEACSEWCVFPYPS